MLKLAPALLALALAGCAASGVKVTDDQVAAFKAGETTKAQAMAVLGKPTMQMRLADNTSIVIYSHYESRVRPATLIPVVGAFVGGADSNSNTMTLRFDASDRLLDTSSSASNFGTGAGLAAGQPAAVPDQPRK